VVASNKARKARLAAVARDRLGYQEYLDLRDSIDKNVSGTYSKLQKKDVPKAAKKKKKVIDLTGGGGGGGGTGSGSGTPAPMPAPNPAAIGLSPDDENKLVVSEQLQQLVETRRQWVDTVGGVFDRKERELPGRIWGLPQRSIYDGIEQDVRMEIERGMSFSGDDRTSKGKAQAKGDDMVIG
jgi:transcriptional adapter 3